MTVEWRRFADDCGLPEHMSPEQMEKLARVFDVGDAQSPWSRAIAALGLSAAPPDGGIVRHHDGAAFIHWGYMVELISGGTARLSDDGIKTSYNLTTIGRLILSQWRISRYVLGRIYIKTPIPPGEEEQIVESLALGICILALTMRLKNMDEQSLATALQRPDTCPPAMRQTIKQIQAIQMRRTQLSPAWARLFPSSGHDVKEIDKGPTTDSDVTRREWRGIGVCGDTIVGRAVIVDRVHDFARAENDTDALILIFARARPETVELFPVAAAALYGDGGVMSHACTIARETNLPCITALGQDFLASIRSQGNVWLSVSPADGKVQILESQAP